MILVYDRSVHDRYAEHTIAPYTIDTPSFDGAILVYDRSVYDRYTELLRQLPTATQQLLNNYSTTTQQLLNNLLNNSLYIGFSGFHVRACKQKEFRSFFC